jgi:hypothetical protein
VIKRRYSFLPIPLSVDWADAAIADHLTWSYSVPSTTYTIQVHTTGKMTHHRKLDLSMFRDDDEDDLIIAPKAKVLLLCYVLDDN